MQTKSRKGSKSQDEAADLSPNNNNESPYFVAIDLGSNSFHMLIARDNQGQLEIIDRVKDMVQLALGVKNGQLSEEAQARALACLERFHERIKDIPNSQIRAVGTKALRAAANGEKFLRKAEKTLATPIRLVSGYEEARLVFIGVAQSISHDHRKRLVIDIGGASTEFIIGQDYRPKLLESLSMGCVTFTDRYLLNSEGELTITPKAMAKAMLAAAEELEQIKANYLRESWDICFGSSGTIKTIAELMPAQTPTGLITAEGIQWLYDEITGGKYKDLGQIPKARRLVLPAGVAILQSIFNQMKIKHLHVSNAALKEGLIFETAGRNKRYDIRDETIAQQIEKYLIDEHQARRVRDTALELFAQLEIHAPKAVNPTKLLGWSASLHEIGLTLSHSGYHHHSRYMVENMDLAGFNRYDQHLLALIVGAHRRKINPDNLAILAQEHRPVILAMVICLRLACLLSRKREDPVIVPRIKLDNDTVRLRFDDQWLESNPLSKQSLIKEAEYLNRINLSLDMA